MKVNTRKKDTLLSGVAARMKIVREEQHITKSEMAAKLGITPSAYNRNESGQSIPGFLSMHYLQKEMNISLDWLLFGHGPMHFTAKHPELSAETSPTQELAEDLAKMPEISAMLDNIRKDEKLKYRILSFYYSCLSGDNKDT